MFACVDDRSLIDIDFSYNETVKVSLATRQAEVVEMYQPMTDLMRQCQDAITECMEAMLVELKRDHSLVRWLLVAPRARRVWCPRTLWRRVLLTGLEPRSGGYKRPKRPIQEL
jgi:hypothetical protein